MSKSVNFVATIAKQTSEIKTAKGTFSLFAVTASIGKGQLVTFEAFYQHGESGLLPQAGSKWVCERTYSEAKQKYFINIRKEHVAVSDIDAMLASGLTFDEVV
jgi:hypothetical protein